MTTHATLDDVEGALWRALAHAGKTPAELGALVCRPPSEIIEALRAVPPARPTPAPESGVRAKAVSADDVAAMRWTVEVRS